MKVNKQKYRSIWTESIGNKIKIKIIDQRFLPFKFVVEDISSTDSLIIAIKDMHLRGAPLIGIAGAYGVYLSSLEVSRASTTFIEQKIYIKKKCEEIKRSRPTAVNLRWAVDKIYEEVKDLESINSVIDKLLFLANQMADEDVKINMKIGSFGLKIIKEIYKNKKNRLKETGKENCIVNILTHCNAGWLATVDYGTALSPIFLANKEKIPVHVWVDETRPRNQGARLTAWELLNEDIPHTVIADNTGGHLMQHDMVDMVIVGSDRATADGDVGNKIGTYLKALASKDNNIPFYVALPTSTIDFKIKDGVRNIPIEIRDQEEVKYIEGFNEDTEEITKILLTNEETNTLNYGFDVTPARLISGLITEKGIVKANFDSIIKLKEL